MQPNHLGTSPIKHLAEPHSFVGFDRGISCARRRTGRMAGVKAGQGVLSICRVAVPTAECRAELARTQAS